MAAPFFGKKFLQFWIKLLAPILQAQAENINNEISYSKIVTIQYSDLSGDHVGNNINIYPNPVSNNMTLNIAAPASNSTTYDVKVINTLGLVIQEKTTSRTTLTRECSQSTAWNLHFAYI